MIYSLRYYKYTIYTIEFLIIVYYESYDTEHITSQCNYRLRFTNFSYGDFSVRYPLEYDSAIECTGNNYSFCLLLYYVLCIHKQLSTNNILNPTSAIDWYNYSLILWHIFVLLIEHIMVHVVCANYSNIYMTCEQVYRYANNNRPMYTYYYAIVNLHVHGYISYSSSITYYYYETIQMTTPHSKCGNMQGRILYNLYSYMFSVRPIYYYTGIHYLYSRDSTIIFYFGHNWVLLTYRKFG